MDVLTTLVMDLLGSKAAGSNAVVAAKQNEKYVRKIKILLHRGYTPWPIPEGTAAVIRYRKPDGTRGLYDQLPNGDPAVILEAGANALTLILAPQVLTAAGKVCMDVVLINRDAELATFDILVNVLPAPVTDGDLESQDYYNYSTLAELNEVIGNLDDLKTTAKSSLVAAINEAAQTGGAGGSADLVVTLDWDTGQASHSSTEIKEAVDANRNVVVFDFSEGMTAVLPLTDIENDIAVFQVDWVYEESVATYKISIDASKSFNPEGYSYAGVCVHQNVIQDLWNRYHNAVIVPGINLNGVKLYVNSTGQLVIDTNNKGLQLVDGKHVEYIYGYNTLARYFAPLTYNTEYADKVLTIGSDGKVTPGDIPMALVSAVNGKTGEVTLDANDVGAIPTPASAAVGQTIVVKAVDESGKPTEWECVDPEAENWDYEKTITLTEDAASVTVNTFDDGTNLMLKKIQVIAVTKNATSSNLNFKLEYDGYGSSKFKAFSSGTYAYADRWIYGYLQAEINNEGVLVSETLFNSNVARYVGYSSDMQNSVVKTILGVTNDAEPTEIFPTKMSKIKGITVDTPEGALIAGSNIRIRGVRV